ncbi:helix-turn-helix domain-containing protein [Ralstonia mojiangensis]|uniref:helix-turn-helix domain-containing protein n=1 Tax=Ralstonia mojiangensis TaxID=2953895 RepID=UPI002090C072|nr:LuxR C-terminal-related transcriptional regulator [Ralstonia mojiangensis]MCO5414712.1 LuxR C-terminal-related transcriptional regulator [Ralstonia mojiangensis]
MPAPLLSSTSLPDLYSTGLTSTAMVARWDAAPSSLAVIFVDSSLLNDSTWLPSQPTLQPMALEDVQQMLSGALQPQGPAASRGADTLIAHAEPKPLTRRQCEILQEVVCGRSNSEIAERLHISIETVKTHMRQLLARLGARNRTELATIYQRSRQVS